MFESEANGQTASLVGMPADVIASFAELRNRVTSRTLLPWGEHCTECVWPTCYATCELYDARPDGKCRRFVDGMVRIPFPESLNSYLLRVSFKRWAKLWSAGNVALYALNSADAAEKRDLGIAKSLQFIPFGKMRNALIAKRYGAKKRTVRNRAAGSLTASAFLVECYNPNDRAVDLTLTIRHEAGPHQFQKLLPMPSGYVRHSVPTSDIERVLELTRPFSIELTPNEIPDGFTLYFGGIDFVLGQDDLELGRSPLGAAGPVAEQKSVCKCVVWDLDNTIWEGTLVEDGSDGLRLRPKIRELLKTLDERGILQSVASKNDHSEALEVLRQFELNEYFLFPQVSWNPKSDGIRTIAQELNIGTDSLLFVDDSAFERAEVSSVFPEIRSLDAADYLELFERPDCQAPQTEESRRRRAMYREQMDRDRVRAAQGHDYVAFLRDCDLRLSIGHLSPGNLERVHELTQRTNQMNFSGNRYTRKQLEAMLKESQLDTFVLDCRDRFGSYGTIGFCVVDATVPRILDLMFSCRIQGKRVEHAFVSHLVRTYQSSGRGDVFANYRKTPRNAPSGQVFDDLGAKLVSDADGVLDLVFSRGVTLPDDGLVALQVN